MVGKKSGKALLREEGLERTGNNMEFTSWPQVIPINQKNYYTEYLKRDEQMLAHRLQHEEARNKMIKEAKDRDRALAQGRPIGPDGDVEMDEDEDEVEDEASSGSKTIVIHLGSQNLRIGLASDALPKTVPMVIARRAASNESEEGDEEPRPKRLKLGDGTTEEPEKMFGDEFATQFTSMSTELKIRMRLNKRRVLPNSKDMVLNHNKRTTHDTIPEHNDPLRIEWTEIPKPAPEYMTGKAALRIPDKSQPRYRLYWPIRNGWINEQDYQSTSLLYEDIRLIIQEAAETQLGISLRMRSNGAPYSCVVIIPDYYERTYVTSLLCMAINEFGFSRVCFIQESLAASFGAGFTNCCVVDIGAEKTSICCVEDGMCIDNSRVNLKYGGRDVTETFIKMMLFDHFPYAEINLRRRYDFMLAEELKQKFCTMSEADVSVQLFDFHLRAPGQDTRKYTFKSYDEGILAPMGFFKPLVFDDSEKLNGRRNLVDKSYDIYEGTPNDPKSSAQAEIMTAIAPDDPMPTPNVPVKLNGTTNGHKENGVSAQARKGSLARIFGAEDTPQPSTASSPVPDADGATPQPDGTGPTKDRDAKEEEEEEETLSVERRDDILPVYPLPNAILASITHAARGSPQKTRDFIGGIMLIGGSSTIPGLSGYLEEALQALQPGYAKDVMIGRPPRELDAQVVVWKGGSVFGRMTRTNDSWISPLMYERLGERILSHQLMFAW